MDLSPACIAIAHEANPDLPFEAMDMGVMTFPDATFDGILAYYSLPYTRKKQMPAVLWIQLSWTVRADYNRDNFSCFILQFAALPVGVSVIGKTALH